MTPTRIVPEAKSTVAAPSFCTRTDTVFAADTHAVIVMSCESKLNEQNA